MTDNRITIALRAWQLAKDAEDAAKDARLSAELQILAILDKPETFKGTCKLDGVSITYGESVKVDSEAIQAWAGEAEYPIIQKLFRWKAEVNAKAWKEASDDIRRVFSRFLETKPSKPAFSRINKETK